MKKAVLYARVSSDRQKLEKTIESQIAELKRQIAKAGNTLVREYVDDGHSGFYLDRPAMNQLREDIKTNEFDSVYFLSADRIARDSTYQNIIVEELIRQRKQIVIGGKDYIDNPENKFTLTVLGAVSQFERAKIIERSMRGRKHWLKQGVLMSNGCQTFGYTYHIKTANSNASYTINKKEAPIVRGIFETYAKGDISLKQIARNLKEKGAYRRPGSNPWSWSHVYCILNNEMYTGVRYFDTMTDANAEQDPLYKKKGRKMVMRERHHWIGIPVPAIISKEIFETVRIRLEHNKKCYRNAKHKQLLSGLMYCSDCGSVCWSYRQYYLIKRSTDTTRIYEKFLYACRNKRNPGSCTTMQIDVRPLDAVVFEMIKETLLDPTSLKTCLKNLNKRVNKEKIEKEVKEFETKIKACGTKKSRVFDLYASGDLGKEEYLKRVAQYDNESVLLKTKKSELLKRVPIVFQPEDIDKALKLHCTEMHTRFVACTDYASRRRFLLDFVGKVTYRNDRVTIEGTIPIGEGGIEFATKRTIDRVELRNQILQHDRNAGRRGTPIRRDYFGYLSANAKIVTPKL